MEKNYDVIVIGSGVAGKNLATELATAGKKLPLSNKERGGERFQTEDVTLKKCCSLLWKLKIKLAN